MEYIFESLGNYVFTLPIFIIAEMILWIYYKCRRVIIKKSFLIGWQLLVCLLIAVCSITNAGGIDDIDSFQSVLRLDEINLIPLVNWGIGDITGQVLNIILFLPLGLLLPLLWKRGTSFLQTALTGFCLSLAVELSQLFNFRATDVDDLIMNTLGTMIGYGLYHLFFRKLTFFQLNTTAPGTKYSPLLCVLFIFAANFLLVSPLTKFVWDMIYS
ncbi:MAG: VanZ family protein [Lachnospiraceae bacterium]|nr:VanZ family protein [Lachnospiraceae bacterium]